MNELHQFIQSVNKKGIRGGPHRVAIIYKCVPCKGKAEVIWENTYKKSDVCWVM